MLVAENIELYYGASHILRRVSLVAERGQVTCVLGRNGVGKTSLMRALMGLQPIRAGRILWDGEDISGLTPQARARRGVALVPQGREIFARLTVDENLRTGLAPLGRGARLPEEIFALFPALATLLKRRGGDLSGGQQQQLAIARALVTRPRLLLLDEPTEGIQPSLVKDIARLIRHLAAQRHIAILLVEQYFEFAQQLADRYLVLERGTVVLSGDAQHMASSDAHRYLTI
jgi:urea transport system ATP-binding protein